MNHVFRIAAPFQVPDGTLVSSFFNSRDSASGLPFGLLDGFSIAAGTIGPKVESKVQMMPFVTQVTFVYSGKLTVRVKDRSGKPSYVLALGCKEAALTEAGSFFQLVNESDETCEVLYITSPAYLFEMCDGKLIYDDSVILDQDWNALESAGWRPALQLPTEGQRRAAEHRLAERSKSASRGNSLE